MEGTTLIITDSMVRKHLSIDDVIARVEDTWRWYGEGRIIMPVKVTTDMGPAGVEGWFNSMPSYVGPSDMAGLKLVGGYAGNPRHGLPYIRANLLLTDPHTGFLRALVAGDWISDMRTGAQPAVAAKYFAAATDVVAIIGAGRQATMCLRCMARTLPMKEVRVCDLAPEARRSFIDRFPDAPFRLVDCPGREATCRGADVIITVTTADEPLVEEPWVKRGALVMTMGSYTEISPELSRKADKLVVDHLGQGMHRGSFKDMVDSGELTAQSFAAEVTEVVAGKKVGRDDAGQRIIVALVGMGCLDLSVGALAYERIIASGENVPRIDLAG
jgi:ornithine cyclodeaminase/alanine dehydrogenase